MRKTYVGQFRPAGMSANVLAVVVHPDDADVFCGGTLAKHADHGVDAEFDDLLDSVRAEVQVLGRRTGVRFAEGFTCLHESTAEFLE